MRRMAGIALATMMGSNLALGADLEFLWTVDGFSNPESVALGPDGTTLYVSNVAGEADAVDGEGFISRVSFDGEMLELRWAVGLNAPKGIVIDQDRLIVSDIDTVTLIDLANGNITSRTEVPGAAFLNDTALAPDGAVLVSDSGGARIYRVAEGEVSIFADGDWLSGANGLLFDGGNLLVSTMGTSGLYAYEDGEAHLIAGGLGDADGVAILADDTYLVSEWPGRLFHVAADGETSTLLDTRSDGIYLNDFLLVGDVLLIPNWEPGTLTAYRVR